MIGSEVPLANLSDLHELMGFPAVWEFERKFSVGE
jgi:hypothetical protein